MTTLNLNVDIPIERISYVLCKSEDQTMWVLADIASRVEATDLHEYIDAIDADASEVMQFFRDMADLIEAGLEAEAE